MGTALLIIFLFGVVGFAALMGVLGLYNGLSSTRAASQLAFSQMESDLTRRSDVVAGLVDKLRVYLKHERPTLEALLLSRNQASIALNAVLAEPLNPDLMLVLLHAEDAVDKTLERLKNLVQASPEVRVSKSIQVIIRELDAVCERLSLLRRAYNSAVETFNMQRNAFPSMVVAGFLGFKEIPLMEFPKPKEVQVEPTVSGAAPSSTVFYG